MSVADLPPASESQTVADNFSGTNSEKIDKLIVAVTDIRAALRWYNRVASFLVPSGIAFFAYVVVSLQATATKVDRLGDRVEFAETLAKERFGAVNTRLEALEKRVDAVERQQRETNDLLRRILDKLDRPAGK